MRSSGANSEPLNFLQEKGTFALFEQAMMESPLKRDGFEDARQGFQPRDKELTKEDALKYEEGRALYAELKAEFGRVPAWLTPRPSTKLVMLCLTWDKKHRGEHLLPATYAYSPTHLAPKEESVY